MKMYLRLLPRFNRIWVVAASTEFVNHQLLLLVLHLWPTKWRLKWTVLLFTFRVPSHFSKMNRAWFESFPASPAIIPTCKSGSINLLSRINSAYHVCLPLLVHLQPQIIKLTKNFFNTFVPFRGRMKYGKNNYEGTTYFFRQPRWSKRTMEVVDIVVCSLKKEWSPLSRSAARIFSSVIWMTNLTVVSVL